MYSFKITMQHKVGEQWPVVLEQKAAEGSLEIRSEGLLSLDLQALASQLLAHDYGVMLGQALFQGAVRDAFLHARAQSEDRLSVQLFVEAPDLRALRWERLCAPFDEQWHFLMLDQRTPFTLALPSKADRRFPPIERKDLRALVVVACPAGLERYQLSPFQVEETVAGIRAALGDIPYDVLANLPDAVGPPTLDALCERLTTTSYPLLHIVCHGQYIAAIDDTVIYLAKEDQQVDPVVSSRLLERLSQIRGERGLPHFAFLATCESASAQAEGALGGLAQRLVRDVGIPAVLAMTDTVTISTAEALTRTFYRHLSTHGHLDLALSEACAGLAERPDCTVASLYSRLGAQPLFAQAVVSPIAPRQQLFSLTQQNRVRMLERVRTIWIGGVLEQSLHDSALLTLGLQEQPDAVMNSWRLVVQEAEQSARPLPPGTRIMQVYDSSDHELLILGAPGAGKTTLLLELTRDLLQRAKQDDTHPIPVVFHLSSWAVKRQPLKEWLMEELNLKYQVPRKLAQEWIKTDQVLPLLDGLDEVIVDSRRACIEAINTYHQAHGFLPLVVTSRSADYLAQTARLRLTSAVTIQLLTQQQVDAYLARGGEPLRTLRAAFQQDAALRELAETPLMLTILTLTYHGTVLDELTALGSLEAKQQQLFASYVQHMLKRRNVETRYTPEQTTHWLARLARQMKQENQTVFYIEQMQLDWLPEGRSRWLYRAIIEHLFPGLLPGLLFGFYTGFNIKSTVAGLLVGLVVWLLFGLLGAVGKEKESAEVVVWSWTRVWRNLGKGLLVGLVAGLLAWQLSEQHYGRMVGLGIGLIELLSGGIFSGLFFELLDGINREIEPTEVVVWSWTSARQNLGKGLLIGLLVVLLFGLSYGLFYGSEYGLALGLQVGLLSGMFLGLIFGLLVVLFFGLFGGLSSGKLDEYKRMRPNQGIWNSARNSMYVGLVAGVIVGVIVGLLYGVVYRAPLYGLTVGISYGLVVGMAFGMRGGGLACIKHAVLRLLLWQHRTIPWNYSRFLDSAAERILLRKVGGGYIFLHRLLLEYFAHAEDESSAKG